MKKERTKSTKRRRPWIVAGSVLGVIGLIAGGVYANQQVYIEPAGYTPASDADGFRTALSLSPFSLTEFADGRVYHIGDETARTPSELQQLYIEAGATEMYVRIGTKRQVTGDNLVNGEEDSNANFHTYDQALQLAEIAAELGIPLNPEVMLAHTYMDMDRQQAPDFSEYPEIVKLQNGKAWEELTLEEMTPVLRAYGTMLATALLQTGAEIQDWNIGNEANFGFAGVSFGLETAVNPALATAPSWMKNLLPFVATSWMADNIWQYNAQQMAAVKMGILQAYDDLGIDSTGVRFSTHLATVASTISNTTAYFETLADNGFAVDVAGISFYPSAPGAYTNKMVMFKKTVTQLNQKLGVPVFIAEFSYPSGELSGPFASWNLTENGYPHTQEGQAAIYADVIDWGKDHGLDGIRYWAPDYSGWNGMALFDFDDTDAHARGLLVNAMGRQGVRP